jgi:rhodanese-related sulfurtransferase
VAAKLKERGFQSIRPLQGGFQAWVSAGFEVQDGPLATGRPATA